MRFNVISNLNNGVGLQQDFLLLRQALEDRGHTVQGVQFNIKPLQILPADVNIFDEVVNPQAFPAAPVQWVLPHPEWWFQQWDRYRYDKVLAKTHDCERIFREKVGNRCQYLGWAARDLYDPSIRREKRFLHIAGKSQFKNTPAVIAGCHLARVPLTVVGEHTQRTHRVSDAELKHLMNSHFCQVMPSAYEGYGHVLHESQSTGQVLITTNAPPMNEVDPAILIPTQGATPYHAGLLHKVSPHDVANAVRQVMGMPEEEVTRFQEEARAQYLIDVRQFHTALDELLLL